MFKGSIVALVTPFTPDGEIDFNTFEKLMHWHLAAKTDAIVLCGITGEGLSLTPEEQRMLLMRGVAMAQGKVPIIAGTAGANTASTLHLTKQAKEAGADACLVLVPYCLRPTPEGCYQHFEKVSEIGLPLIVYHHPSRTGIRLPIDALKEILRLPHVAGVKEGTGDLTYTNELMGKTRIPIFSGDDILALAMLAQGAQGIISVVANVIPQQWKHMCALLLQGEITAARKLFEHFQPLVEALFLETNPQCVKYALAYLNKCASVLRLPMVEPRAETKRKIEEVLDALVIPKFPACDPQGAHIC
jgi:4-hydroxy-tetrahydrodipicolinate synthase